VKILKKNKHAKIFKEKKNTRQYGTFPGETCGFRKFPPRHLNDADVSCYGTEKGIKNYSIPSQSISQ